MALRLRSQRERLAPTAPRAAASSLPPDSDHDGIGDACDPTPLPDADADGVSDATDNYPSVANQLGHSGVSSHTRASEYVAAYLTHATRFI